MRQAILDLEKQRMEIDRERLALATQVSMLAQEVRCSAVLRLTLYLNRADLLARLQVRFGKRLTIAQLIGIFALIIFVGFTRGLPTSPFLHLATAAQTERGGLRWRRDRRERDSSIDNEPARPEGAQLQPATDGGESHLGKTDAVLNLAGCIRQKLIKQFRQARQENRIATHRRPRFPGAAPGA